jgi:serine protease AprX
LQKTICPGGFVKPQRFARPQGWRLVVAAAVALGGVFASPALAGSTPAPAGEDQVTRVIVEAEPGQVAAVGTAATDLGGMVVSRQQMLSTVVVDMPDRKVSQLREAVGVRRVTNDSRVKLQDTGILDPVTSLIGPTGLPGDMTNVSKLTGAQTFWKNGYYGQGIDVALLDSGVVPVNGLTATNKLVMGPDLSFESQVSNLRYMDTFGHGTHMAGIIGGRDNAATPNFTTDNTNFVGMAPSSRIVSLKLADAQGNTDVSQVIAAIDWVVAHGRDAGLNIRVMNMSFGTDSTQDYRMDPLSHAAEVAWHSGVVVVVSAGNGDGTRLGLANPAYNPAVIAVGAQNTKGTADRADDAVPAFSQRGAAAVGMRTPDLVAPGVSIVSLRAPGSFIDTTFSAGAVGTRFFKGSGTSQSAAVVSGAAALLLSQRPTLTPDQVKDILRRSAKSLAGFTTDAQGAGALDLNAAFATNPGRGVSAPAKNAGGGSLEKARGHFKVKFNGVPVTGEVDILGNPVDTDAVATEETSTSPDALNGATWANGQWQGSPALGASWTGATWAGATWAGATWAGATWAGATWAGATWAGATWAGATWAGATWADVAWANDLWSSAGWE